ncbi:pimeloyl-ACP methyl ester carboxylesterase [Rhodococcus sp. 27YEA15]|uniref:alpha/beta fold hydrolase n=1 Tax=Rhodococcus sp. 27YEA15 TaxID=3156259 RepID=UPI003C7E0B25
MPFVQTDSARINYTDTGGDGPVLVLTHGFLMDNEMFAPQRALTAVARIIAWDSRGHGATTTTDSRQFTYWDQAQDLLAVMDGAGVDSAVIGGMSQGGFTALRTALIAPERVDALVLMGTTALDCTAEAAAEYEGLFSYWMGDAPLEPVARSLAPNLIGGTEEDQAPWIAKWLSSDRSRIDAASRCLIARDSVVSRLGEISCPAVIVRGELDQSFGRPETELLSAGLPGSRGIVEVPGAGHGANLTHPEPVNELLSAFLSER